MPINILNCYCNICPNDTCSTTPHRQSQCFKSVERHYNQTDSTYYLDTIYGCVSGGDGLLAPMQCHANSLPHTKPIFIKCCRDQDYCNEYLPDPVNDPRFKITLPNEDNSISIPWKITIAIVFICIFAFLTIIQLIRLIRSRSTRKSNISSSTCTSKSELEKDLANLDHQQQSGQFTHNPSSNLSSTNTYSLSDDPCRKPDLLHDSTELMPQELTSGLGEHMLNQRTIAQTIGAGKTDHVGSGRFGRVFRGVYHGESVAVKAFRGVDQDSWSREDTIFRYLNHENIVRFIASQVTAVSATSTEIWMFLEFCPYGSLCDYLDHNEVLGHQQAAKLLYSIINGLNYLHEDFAQGSSLYKPSIAHRDIKSKNILMKTPESCCIADFGHALIKINEDKLDYGKYPNPQVGTIRYMAPEILRVNPSLNYKHFSTFSQADLYQYGLIMWEVCNRTALDVLHPAGKHQLPYDGVVPQNPEIKDMIKIVCDDQYRPPILDKWLKYPIMKRIAELMIECWRPNPKARMETLGVKKKMKDLYDQIMTSHHNLAFMLYLKNDPDKSKSDATL